MQNPEGQLTRSSCKAACTKLKALRNGDKAPGNEIPALLGCVVTGTWNNSGWGTDPLTKAGPA